MPVVLVVDDNPASYESLVDVLEMHGIKARWARSGEEALAQVEKERPDCILLDTVLPGMDGFEVCEKLKGRPETADVPVIFLTGRRSDEAAVVRALDLGASDFLVKPVRIPELIARLQAAIRSRALRDSTGREPTPEPGPIEGREAFLSRLVQELERAARRRRALTCVTVELVFPPDVALTAEEGAAVKKELLPQVGACRRQDDVWGHTEEKCCSFILATSARPGGQALAERIRARVTRAKVVVGGREIPLNIVAGLAEASPEGPPTAAELLRRADAAVARSRATGPGTITCWTPGM
jgi:PleD family two-component response regulator